MTRWVVVALIGLGVLLAASALGWFGGVVVCGADRAPGCVAWPAPANALVWGAFVLGVAALVVWQVRYLDR
jgi:hypothetical protein